ncbi:MAG: AraC family transcriptional regulator [Neptunomonas phycophila]|uniref:AraC family transcriptional regulator n=2 Tax=Neptunomonas phycophila TaxID=1572645 RepID=UPI003B8D953F
MAPRNDTSLDTSFKLELELSDPHYSGSVRYLQHGADSPLIRWHCHKEYELHLIVATSGKMFIGDYIGNFSPMHLVLTGPHLPHNWISRLDEDKPAPLRDMLLQFSGDFIQQCKAIMPEMSMIDDLLKNASVGVMFEQSIALEVEPLFRQASQTSGFSRLVLFFSILERLSREKDYRLLSSTSFDPLLDESAIDRVNVAVNYIMQHYQAGLTLEDVASEVGMKPTYFSKFFKRSTGIRFIEFVNNLRINRACERLVGTTESITEICFQVGFNNIANFNRRFVSLKGMTPSDYRKQAAMRYYRPGGHIPAPKSD